MFILNKHSYSCTVFLISVTFYNFHFANVKADILDEDNLEDTESYYHELDMDSKSLFDFSKWKVTGGFMATCTTEEDCNAAFHMICKSGYCVCKPGDLFFEWPKYGCFSKVRMFGECEVSGQCIAMNANTYCNPDNGHCTCSPNFFFNGRECTMRYDGSNLKAQEVYKAAVVAAACFIVAVVGIFVACIVRRSFCRRDQHLQQSESNRNSDIFSISDEIAALRAVDKPPSYEEVLQIERTFYGIPPPEYSAPRSVSSSAVYQVPSNCASEHVTYSSLPYTSECTSSVPPFQENPGNLDTANLECSKECDQADSEVRENSRPLSSLPEMPPSRFLAAAEVLTPPSGIVEATENVPSISLPSIASSSRGRCNHHYSSTPPPRIRRSQLTKPIYTSSSLPSSPILSSHSVGAGLDLPSILRSELLNADCHSPILSASPFEPKSLAVEGDVSSISNKKDTEAPSDCSNKDGASALAYDNLGFVSDFHM